MAKLRAGQPALIPSAREWNRHVDASNWYHQNVALGKGGGNPLSSGGSNLIEVKNTGASALPQGSVVQLGDYVLGNDEVENGYIWLNGDEPDETGTNFFAILTAPVEAGKIIHAWVTGPCVALVDVTDTGHTHASVESGETHLVSGTSGPVLILANPSGTTGTKLLPVVIDRSSAAATPNHVQATTGSTMVDPIPFSSLSKNNGFTLEDSDRRLVASQAGYYMFAVQNIAHRNTEPTAFNTADFGFALASELANGTGTGDPQIGATIAFKPGEWQAARLVAATGFFVLEAGGAVRLHPQSSEAFSNITAGGFTLWALQVA